MRSLSEAQIWVKRSLIAEPHICYQLSERSEDEEAKGFRRVRRRATMLEDHIFHISTSDFLWTVRIQITILTIRFPWFTPVSSYFPTR